jgi:hypothetical protein
MFIATVWAQACWEKLTAGWDREWLRLPDAWLGHRKKVGGLAGPVAVILEFTIMEMENETGKGNKVENRPCQASDKVGT